MEEQLRGDKQELKTREQKQKATDAKRIRGIVHENDKKKKGMSHVPDEMRQLMHHDEQELLGLWDGRWLVLKLCANARREEVEYIRCHKMYTRVPRETCLRETGKAPIKTGWEETDKGQPQKPHVRVRWVAKEYKTHARPELYAMTQPLVVLLVVLSEVATGKRGGKVLASVEVRRAYFYAPSRWRVFVELPPENGKVGDEHKCGLLPYKLYCTRDAA